MVAVWSGSTVGLTTRKAATVAVPVLVPAAAAVTGEAAARPRGSSSTRRMPLAARVTGWSRKRSVAAGAGVPRLMRKPSTTEPSTTVCAWPSASRVRRQLPAPSLASAYSLASNCVASVTVRPTLDTKSAARRACIRRRRQRLRIADGEQRRAARRRHAEVQAERLLLVHRRRHRRRHLTEQATRLQQIVVLEAQQARHRARADQGVGQGAHAGALDDAQRHARGVERVGRQIELERLRAQHQTLAAADEDAERAVVGRDRRHLHVAAEFGDQPVAQVEQVVGRVTATLGDGDAVVHGGDVRRDLVHLIDRAAQLLRDTGLDRVELPARAREARRQLAGAAEHHLARGQILRVAGHVDHGVEKLAGREAHALLAAREHRLQLRQLVEPCAVVRSLRPGRRWPRAAGTGRTRAPRSSRRRPCRRSRRRRTGRWTSAAAPAGASSRRRWHWRCCGRWSAAPRSWRTSPACRSTSMSRRS